MPEMSEVSPSFSGVDGNISMSSLQNMSVIYGRPPLIPVFLVLGGRV